MPVTDQSLNWGAICDSCPDLPGCIHRDVLICPADKSLQLYEEAVIFKKEA
ncbi:hypothetical protein SDC9_167561 [bioreactor metagenome]|uniref:Uncharacterized protein n=1 Tax=bioreactor metagenome TaxID=1076179 RepID=A0A645G8D5_9ZZZZ